MAMQNDWQNLTMAMQNDRQNLTIAMRKTIGKIFPKPPSPLPWGGEQKKGSAFLNYNKESAPWMPTEGHAFREG